MNIFFDFDETDPGYYDRMGQIEKAMAETVWNHIFDKLFHLIDKLDFEDKEDGNRHILIDTSSQNWKIIPKGYSLSLSSEIIRSFNDNEIEELVSKMKSTYNTFMN